MRDFAQVSKNGGFTVRINVEIFGGGWRGCARTGAAARRVAAFGAAKGFVILIIGQARSA